MAKISQQPETNQRQTRAKNANTHPGRAAMEALAVRRTREVIELEKKAKEERRQAREKKKADREAAVKDIADFENRMALDDFEQEAQFP
jgi:DNA-binding protein H-NS